MKKNHFTFCSILLLMVATGIGINAKAQDSTARKHNSSQARQNYQYRDLRTGQDINLRYDKNSKITYNAVTNEPVDYYLNVTTGDTVSGRGQYIVNSYMTNNGGTWGVDTTRLRVSDNGIYIIDGNRKLKTEKPYKEYIKSSGRKDQ